VAPFYDVLGVFGAGWPSNPRPDLLLDIPIIQISIPQGASICA